MVQHMSFTEQYRMLMRIYHLHLSRHEGLGQIETRGHAKV